MSTSNEETRALLNILAKPNADPKQVAQLLKEGANVFAEDPLLFEMGVHVNAVLTYAIRNAAEAQRNNNQDWQNNANQILNRITDAIKQGLRKPGQSEDQVDLQAKGYILPYVHAEIGDRALDELAPNMKGTEEDAAEAFLVQCQVFVDKKAKEKYANAQKVIGQTQIRLKAERAEQAEFSKNYRDKFSGAKAAQEAAKELRILAKGASRYQYRIWPYDLSLTPGCYGISMVDALGKVIHRYFTVTLSDNKLTLEVVSLDSTGKPKQNSASLSYQYATLSELIRKMKADVLRGETIDLKTAVENNNTKAILNAVHYAGISLDKSSEEGAILLQAIKNKKVKASTIETLLDCGADPTGNLSFFRSFQANAEVVIPEALEAAIERKDSTIIRLIVRAIMQRQLMKATRDVSLHWKAKTAQDVAHALAGKPVGTYTIIISNTADKKTDPSGNFKFYQIFMVNEQRQTINALFRLTLGNKVQIVLPNGAPHPDFPKLIPYQQFISEQQNRVIKAREAIVDKMSEAYKKAFSQDDVVIWRGDDRREDLEGYFRTHPDKVVIRLSGYLDPADPNQHLFALSYVDKKNVAQHLPFRLVPHGNEFMIQQMTTNGKNSTGEAVSLKTFLENIKAISATHQSKTPAMDPALLPFYINIQELRENASKVDPIFSDINDKMRDDKYKLIPARAKDGKLLTENDSPLAVIGPEETAAKKARAAWLKQAQDFVGARLLNTITPITDEKIMKNLKQFAILAFFHTLNTPFVKKAHIKQLEFLCDVFMKHGQSTEQINDFFIINKKMAKVVNEGTNEERLQALLEHLSIMLCTLSQHRTYYNAGLIELMNRTQAEESLKGKPNQFYMRISLNNPQFLAMSHADDHRLIKPHQVTASTSYSFKNSTGETIKIPALTQTSFEHYFVVAKVNSASSASEGIQADPDTHEQLTFPYLFGKLDKIAQSQKSHYFNFISSKPMTMTPVASEQQPLTQEMPVQAEREKPVQTIGIKELYETWLEEGEMTPDDVSALVSAYCASVMQNSDIRHVFLQMAENPPDPDILITPAVKLLLETGADPLARRKDGTRPKELVEIFEYYANENTDITRDEALEGQINSVISALSNFQPTETTTAFGGLFGLGKSKENHRLDTQLLLRLIEDLQIIKATGQYHKFQDLNDNYISALHDNRPIKDQKLKQLLDSELKPLRKRQSPESGARLVG